MGAKTQSLVAARSLPLPYSISLALPLSFPVHTRNDAMKPARLAINAISHIFGAHKMQNIHIAT